MGRVLRADDCATPDAAPVAVIGEDLWRARFGADPAVPGATLPLNGRDFTVVGVLPRDYDGQLRGPIWIPYTMASAFFDGHALSRERATPWLMGLTGRLRPGVPRAAAVSELRLTARQQDRLVPGRQTVLRVTDGSMIEAPLIRTQAAWIVPLVMGALSLVLLIACLNVAVLMLSRAVARRHEIAVRTSLGASRARLLSMLLTERTLVALMAAPPSAYFAFIVPRVLKAFIPTLPYYHFAVDGAVFGHLTAATLVAGLVAGLAPALESMQSDVAPSLNRQRVRWFGTRRWQLRDVLIACQVAMSLVLLVGAVLFVRAERALAANPGFETEHVIAAQPRVMLPPHTPQTASALYVSLEERARALPGVRATAFTSTVGDSETTAADVAAAAETAAGSMAPTAVMEVSARYFEVIGLGFVRGGAFPDETDRTGVVVSESLARSLWSGRDPVGERLRLAAAPDRTLHVVGVARDLPSVLGKPAQRTIYRLRDANRPGDVLLVRFDGDERQTADAIRAAIVMLDPNAVVEPRTLASLRREAADRFLRLVEMIVFLAGVGLLLASIGVYGAVAFAVARRLREIGIRIALGASARHVAAMVLWTGWKPIGGGLAVGTVVTLMVAPTVARLFANTPAQIDPFDPVAYLLVALVLAAASTVAMAGPCRRATSTEPAHALHRDEVTMTSIRLPALVVLASLAAVVPARADGFISPFIGYNFGGDSGNCVSLTNCQERRNNYGVSVGATGPVFGAELDFGYAPQFFGETPGGDNAVLTLMTNLMLTIPAGPVRPYGVIGLGLIRPHAQLNSSIADVSQNTLGYDIGGGINIFFLHSLGIRGDLRHLHTLQDITLGVLQNQPLDFWRASAGITLRF